MPDHPRFQAEYFIHHSLEELEHYASVFHDRIARAFDSLEEEAERIRDEAYSRWSANAGPDDDPLRAQEDAYFVGVDFYLASEAIRQGVYNLMVAGLYHLLEQQAQYLATRVLSNPVIQPDAKGGFKQLKKLLKQKFSVDIESFKSWPPMNELILVANTVKHGGGGSANKLKPLNPDLFKNSPDPLPRFGNLPLRPLVGEGLRLTEDHFKTYHNCVQQFWDELTAALLPVFCPSPRTPITG